MPTTPTVTLVNANEMRPPVGPIAFDYLAAALHAAGVEPHLLDLTWAGDDPSPAVADHFRDHQPTLVGLTLRNLDDCYLAGRHSCLPHARDTLALLRAHTAAPIVLGGCGYSIVPGPILDLLGAEFGLAGDGEEALPRLAHALARGDDPRSIPGLLFRDDAGALRLNPPLPADLARVDLSPRDFLDNARYWREGGQAGFETRRGCDRRCIYCADPLAKGRTLRLRPPEQVAREIANLAARGVTHLHTCDAEFNLPPDHAADVCRAMIEHGLADRVQWWAYCAPSAFDAGLAALMRRAGCVGIDFGADHGCDDQLARLGRDHRVADLRRVADACRTAGIDFMFDLLLGAPGETRETMRVTIDLMRDLAPTRVGISAGVRLYPGTPLAAQVFARPRTERRGLVGVVDGNPDLLLPVFYVSPEVGGEIDAVAFELVDGDQRFFCAEPDAALANYNYRENPTLVDAIAAGHRGAYWHILHRLAPA